MDDFQKPLPVRFHQTPTLFEASRFLLVPIIIIKHIYLILFPINMEIFFTIIIYNTSTKCFRQGASFKNYIFQNPMGIIQPLNIHNQLFI